MRYLLVLFCCYYLLHANPAYAGQKCPVGEISTDLNLSFKFDRVDMFAEADTNSSTVNLFPPTLSRSICWRPAHRVMVRKAKSESWFEVLLDRKGKKTGIAAR